MLLDARLKEGTSKLLKSIQNIKVWYFNFSVLNFYDDFTVILYDVYVYDKKLIPHSSIGQIWISRLISAHSLSVYHMRSYV